jgi:predicted nucleic acid-binding protein
VVRDFLTARFPGPHLFLEPDAHKALVSRLVNLGISGGATYDALIAMTAISAGASLLTRDRRAASTYQRCGAAVRFIP